MAKKATGKGKQQTAAEVGKEKALEMALQQIRKDFGESALMKLGDKKGMNVEVVSTGNIAVDTALGVGGLPRGRITEIYGPESSGKTTLALHCVAEVQKTGGTAAYIDAEHALDPAYAQKLGVDIDELFVSQPDSGEQALDITEALVRSGAIDIVVIDSVAALVPKAEIEGDMGDSHVGLQARLMSQALRKLTGVISRTGAIAIFINQLREKVGQMGYGSPETTTGGKALKFYASVRIDVRKIETLKGSDGQPIGSRTRIKIVKNKVAPPFKQVEVDMMYGEGMSAIGSIMDMAIDRDMIKKSGAWFSYNDMRIGQGRENAKKYLRDNPEVCAEIEEALRRELADELAVDGGAPASMNAREDEDADADSDDVERIMDETMISDDDLEDDIGF
ncbi:MAG: recombinase RecA [Candidatus Fimadaptatus sp.]